MFADELFIGNRIAELRMKKLSDDDLKLIVNHMRRLTKEQQ